MHELELYAAMLEASNARAALNATPESPELRAALDGAETALRAALDASIQAGRNPPPAEERALVERVELRNYLAAVLADRHLSGAEAELNAERGLGDMNVLPWDALLPRGVEERTDDATAVASAAFGHEREPVLARIFKRSRLSWLGARMPSVASGEPIYPVLTAGTSGSAQSAGGEVEADAATFVGQTVGPTRLSARYLFGVEDVVRFPVEEALRSDLRMVMTDLLDEQVFNGTGVAPNMNGLFRNNAAGPLGVNATEGTLTTYDQVLTKVYSYVDGAAAGSLSEVRTLVGMATYRFFGLLRETASGRDLFEHLMALGAGVSASAHVPAAASNVQQAIQTRRSEDLVVPVWQGVRVIRDPYSKAQAAQVSITAHMLANLKLLRSGNWRKVAFKLA